jgi:hypothetical protein
MGGRREFRVGGVDGEKIESLREVRLERTECGTDGGRCSGVEDIGAEDEFTADIVKCDISVLKRDAEERPFNEWTSGGGRRDGKIGCPIIMLLIVG